MANKFEFTEVALREIPPALKGKRFYCYDTLARGLGLSVTDTGTKTFIVYRWINGKPERVTLGRFPDLTLERARDLAADVNSKIAHGINPNDEKKRHKAGRDILLQDVLKDFLQSRQSLSQRTVYDYQRIVNVYLQDWKTKPIVSITQDMVDHRHKDIATGMAVVLKSRKGALEEAKVCSEAQANYSMRVLRVLINFAMAQYKDSSGRPLIVDNPVKQLFQTQVSPKSDRKHDIIKNHDLKPWFSAVSALKSDAANARPEVTKSFFVFLLMTGLRRQEAAKLRKTQIDFKNRTLTMFDVQHQQPLFFPLSDYLYIMLKQLVGITNGPYVFPGNGPRGYLVDPYKQMLKIIEESGVPFTLHGLRRTYVAIAESLDIPAYALKRLVDHKVQDAVAGGDVSADVEKLRKPMQMITDFILKCAEAKKSADAIASLSGRDIDSLKEKIGHILAVRNSLIGVNSAGADKLK